MNKNVKLVSGERFIRIRIGRASDLHGWAVKLLSGLEPEYKAGWWLSDWSTSNDEAKFSFTPDMHTAFKEEQEAVAVFNLLRENEIETEVVKVG